MKQVIFLLTILFHNVTIVKSQSNEITGFYEGTGAKWLYGTDGKALIKINDYKLQVKIVQVDDTTYCLYKSTNSDCPKIDDMNWCRFYNTNNRGVFNLSGGPLYGQSGFVLVKDGGLYLQGEFSYAYSSLLLHGNIEKGQFVGTLFLFKKL